MNNLRKNHSLAHSLVSQHVSIDSHAKESANDLRTETTASFQNKYMWSKNVSLFPSPSIQYRQESNSISVPASPYASAKENSIQLRRNNNNIQK